jgi:hypothetical protein
VRPSGAGLNGERTVLEDSRDLEGGRKPGRNGPDVACMMNTSGVGDLICHAISGRGQTGRQAEWGVGLPSEDISRVSMT